MYHVGSVALWHVGSFQHARVLSCLSCTTVTSWAVAHQALLSMGILQARILGWIAVPSSRGLPSPGVDSASRISCIGSGFFTTSVTWEAWDPPGSNPCPLHWQADSQPLDYQGSPKFPLLSLKCSSLSLSLLKFYNLVIAFLF